MMLIYRLLYEVNVLLHRLVMMIGKDCVEFADRLYAHREKLLEKMEELEEKP